MPNLDSFDVAVIGAGPGGYVAAIRAAQKNKKVALIEREYLGGTCLNVGCIPTKTLVANAHVLEQVKKAGDFGIHIDGYTLDYAKCKTRKDSVLQGIRKSLEGLIKSNNIEIIQGSAKFVSKNELKVLGDQPRSVKADAVIIATGSTTLDIPAFPCDHDKILNSTSILEMTKLPKSLAIIGGGYIGCEFASLYHELGVKVTILEAMDSILQAQGATVAGYLTDHYTKNGIEIKTGVRVEAIDTSKSGVCIKLADGSSVDADNALISIGRKVVTEGLGLESIGVALTDRGFIDVNDKMETNIKGIYAIGDVTGKAMLAHVASHQAIVAADNAVLSNDTSSRMHYNAVPAVIFTIPEIAMVGLSLEEAKSQGHPVNVGTFPFQALGKSQAAMQTEGFSQIITHQKTGEILGALVIGHEASALIGEIALAIQNELTIECISETIHAHPTIGEGWLEAALLAQNTPIHFPPKPK